MNDSLQTATEVASQVDTTEFSLMDMITSGGPIGTTIMVILFIMLVVALYIFFERIFAIKKYKVSSPDLVNNVKDDVYQGNIDAAIALTKRTPTPEARLIKKGLSRMGRPIKEISDAIENQAQLEVFSMEKNLNVLATIAGAAPMLGFLGTVIGMIQAFQKLASEPAAADKTQLLSEGIYTAMGTTAFGLIVGLLAYIFYNTLVSRVETTVYSIQSSVTDFLDAINQPISS